MTDEDTASPGTPRWLDAEEQRAWRSYLRTVRLLENALDRDLQRHGIQLSEYEVLSMLSEASEGHMRMSALADLVVQSRSRLTHTAARLERRGWVNRRPSPVDRRGVELTLTEQGRTALEEMAVLHVESVRCNLTDQLTREEFLALGEAMRVVGMAIRKAPGGEDLGKGADAC